MRKEIRLFSLLLAIFLLCACTAVPSEKETEDAVTNQATDSQETSSMETHKPEEGVSYEEYLAALTVFALSMEYPDFSLRGTYTATAVSIADKEYSEGIYMLFDSMGEEFCAHVYPIAQERTEAYTLDLYAAQLGFAAFDLMEQAPQTEGLTPLESQAFSQLLSELTAISLYGH